MMDKKLKIAICAFICIVLCTICAYAAEPIGAVGASLSQPDMDTIGSAECDIGDYIADAVRKETGADIALVNSGDIAGGFDYNMVYRSDIDALFTENRTIAVCQVTPAQLTKVLEDSLSHVTLDPETETIDRAASDFGGFLQLSGISLTYDASARAGERVYRLQMADGTKLDASDTTTTLTIAASEYMLAGGWGYSFDVPYEVTQITLAETVEHYIQTDDITFESGRMTAIGANESWVVNSFPPAILLAVLGVLIAVFIGFRVWKDRSKEVTMANRPFEETCYGSAYSRKSEMIR